MRRDVDEVDREGDDHLSAGQQAGDESAVPVTVKLGLRSGDRARVARAYLSC
jgi:hypothetical protein